jgi:membrane associated rhomboid family serine protease
MNKSVTQETSEQAAGTNNQSKNTGSLFMLFAINALVFATLKFVLVIYQMSELDVAAFDKHIFNQFTLPASIESLSHRPWALLTYMFTHQSFFSFAANMLWLGAFGYVLTDLTGAKKLIPVYIYGGLFSGAVFIIAYYTITTLEGNISTATMLNANAAVMAVAIATTAVKPDYRFFPLINGGIPLWILTVVYVIIDFASVKTGDPAHYIAHAAGAFMGFLFIYQMRKGRDWSSGMNNFFDWVNNLFNPNKKQQQRSARDEFFYKVHGTHPYKRMPNITSKRIDEILDKINQQGYHLLTDEEKDILRRAAEEGDL